jgi:type IV pilus assembly protein PilM
LELLKSLLSRQPSPLIGVDISASSVKVVELSRSRTGELVLERCAMEPLEKGWVTDGNIEKFDEVADALRRVVRKSGTKTKSAALALPASAVITKRILLPAGLSDDEMEIQVESEANQYIPFSLDEVSLDYCVIGPSQTSTGDAEVLIAASRKEKVQDRQGLAEAAGLKPVIVDIESYASRMAADRLIKMMPDEGQDKLIAVVEIGSTTTAMQVILNGDVIYERDQAFGGGQLTQMIARQYGFSIEEAETKKRAGDLPEDYESAVLPQFRMNLSQEIVRALQFFFTSTPNSRVDNILLAGGTAGVSGLLDAVQEESGFPSLVANPFNGMTIGSNVRANKLNRESASYLTATGLALRRYSA